MYGRPEHRWGIILKCILKKWCQDVDQIHLAQNIVEWWGLVNMLMNVWIS